MTAAPEAITAAAVAIRGVLNVHGHEHPDGARYLALAALGAAAPLIAAAERERCAQLAEQRAAEISDVGVAAIFHMFAARLRRRT